MSAPDSQGDRHCPCTRQLRALTVARHGENEPGCNAGREAEGRLQREVDSPGDQDERLGEDQTPTSDVAGGC